LLAVAFPSQLSIDFEGPLGFRQLQREAQRAFFGDATCKLYRHATFANVKSGRVVSARAIALDGNLHGHAQLQTAFALHQGADGAKAGFGALNGKGFVENEMGTHFKPAFEA